MTSLEVLDGAKTIRRLSRRDPGDLDQVIPLRNEDDLSVFYWLVENAPPRSVVCAFHPEFAKIILARENPKNRPLYKGHAVYWLGNDLTSGNFAVTGDTLKFASNGNLIDGQHRLEACAHTGIAFQSHAVFGISPKVFDILDQGRKRTAGDILALDGIVNAPIVAAAIRWARAIEAGIGSSYSTGPSRDGAMAKGKAAITFTPRNLRKMAKTEYAGMSEWVTVGLKIREAYRHPAAMMGAILYLIAQKDRKLAVRFAHEWLHGSRLEERNKGFDVLSARFLTIQRQNNGRINNQLRCALIVMTFNYWQADRVPHSSALKWRRGLKFPTIQVNGRAPDIELKEAAE